MIVRLLAVIVLLLLNGFFVAAEFALVRSRRTRLEAMTRAGDWKARIALRATSNLGRVLSASQLGITLASLGLGWVAESTIGEAMKHWFVALPLPLEVSLRMTIAATVAMMTITYFHVVFGELAPRAAALNHPEEVARWLAPPLLLFGTLMKPFIWVLNRSSHLVLHLFNERSDMMEEPVHSPEELRMLVEQSQESGALQEHDAELIAGVFEFSEKNAREVMTPRMEIVAIPVAASLSETLAIVSDGGFSRYPVYDDSIDHIIGVLLAKDLIAVLQRPPENFSLTAIMRPVHVIPGSREVEEVLADFKRRKEHLAIVLDEYGGTAGIVTMEDLLEEIVGEILDEYDESAEPPARAPDGAPSVPGATHIGELNERFGLDIPTDGYTTIGGYVFGALGRLPQPGDRVTVGGAIFTVSQMDGRRVDVLAVDLHAAGDRRGKERADPAPTA